MKIILAFFMACGLVAETKTETELKELKRRLAETQAALAAERAEKASGTQKLTEAVRDAAETSKEIGPKVEAAADRIIDAQASGTKAVENVAAATQSAAKKSEAVVTNLQAAVTSAITTQTRQQEKLLTQAQEAARKLEESNRVLAQTAEENRIAKEENARQLIAVRADLKEMKFNQELAAAKDDTALKMQRYKLISDVSTPFIQALGAVLLALVVVFQIRASKQASATHTMVNGERTKMLQEIEELKRRIEKDGPENGHPST